jgi:ABC-type transport system substrate-binding protein
MRSSVRSRTRSRSFAAAPALLAVVLLAAALFLTACGSATTSGGAPSTGTSATPQRGGTMIVTYQGEPQTLDPAIDFEGNGWSMEHCLFGNLLNYSSGPSAQGTKIIADMATEVPTVQNGGITNGGKTYVFHIKPGIKFAPPVNREVTAQDFVYSFERMMKLPKAPAKGYYDGIVGLQAFTNGKAAHIAGYHATDKYTLQVDLEKPIGTFLNIMEMPFSAPVAKEWVAKWGSQIGRHPLGTGPYLLDHWSPNQELLLKRNPNFTGTDTAYPDGLDFQFSVSSDTAVLKVKSGQADILGDYIPPAAYPGLRVDPQWKNNVVVEPAIWLDYLFINQTVKPFDNLQVRLAIEWAIDRAHIVKLLSGTAQALNQIYPAGMPGHVDGAAGDFYGYDPAKAKQILAAAGYPNGFSTTIYSHNVDPWPKVLQAIQADLGAVGIKATIKVLERASYWTLIGKKGAVGLGLNDWSMDYPDPFDYTISLFSKSSAIDEGTNPSFWWSPQTETMMTQAQTMTDPTARLAKFDEIQKLIMDAAPAVPLYQPAFSTLRSNRMGGVYIHPVWIFDWQHFWINK